MNRTTAKTSLVVQTAGISTTLLYRLKDPKGNFISEFSKWEDDVWKLSKEFSMNWKIKLPDKTLLTDSCNAGLLDMFKRFFDSAMHDCQSGKPISITNTSEVAAGIRRISGFMILHHHNSFSTLDHLAFEEFIDDWLAKFFAGHTDDELDDSNENQFIEDSHEGFGPLYKVVRVWSRLWAQSPALEEIDIPGLPEDPLDGKSSHKYTQEIFDSIRGRIPPLPDEVALPCMNEAHRWIEQRADDIIRLNEHCMKFVARGPYNKKGGAKLTYSRMKEFGEFTFSTETKTGKAWHESVKPRTTVNGIGKTFWWVPLKVVRRLIDDLFGACMLVIQSESGMRPGELRSLPPTNERTSDSHDAIVMRPSIKGLNELFFLRSLLHKGHPAPVPEEWLAGARPIGSSFIPGPVKAVRVLQRLLEPWRSMAQEEVKAWLLTTTKTSGALPVNATNVVHSTTSTVRNAQRNFIARNVDLSRLPNRSALGEDLTIYRKTKGRCVLPYQWRKSYAMYVIRTDRRMAPAVATQYKHVSVAITEDAYFSNNPDLLRERNAQQSRAAAGFMYRRVVGKEPCAGRVAKLFDKYADVIREVVGDTNRPEGIQQLQEWCESRGIRVFWSPPGKCFIPIAPMEAQCHKLAGTLHWSVKQPNFETREPDICAGCACFGVDAEHADFWKSRYIENETAWRHAKQTGLTYGFRVIQQRADVAANMLHLLQIKLPRLPRAPASR